MRHFALSALGRDRPGIVAGVSHVLLEHAVNIEDSQMTILRGHFAMVLILAAPDGVNAERLGTELDAIRAELGLEALSLGEVATIDAAGPDASHIVSVYGVDHPGIVHAVSAALAERGASITDLTTRLVEGGGAQPLYAMMMEVALGDDAAAASLGDALARIGTEQGLELTFRRLERDAL